MTRVAPIVPAEDDLLCEGCGYTLNGLPGESNCPECGRPIIESIGSQRVVPAWEQPGGRTMPNFLRLCFRILVQPTRFYQTLATRRQLAPAALFAHVQWSITAIFFGAAATLHARWYLSLAGYQLSQQLVLALLLTMMVLTYVTLVVLTRFAGRLTNWEATYRGLRLPLSVVLRGMYYHAAHYVPVAALALATVAGYQLLLRAKPIYIQHANTYLYVLCAQVILFAAYLFHTYWIAMRNMMYANR